MSKNTVNPVRKVSILGAGWLGLPLGEFLVGKGFSVKGSTTTRDKMSELKEAGISPYSVKVEDQLLGEDLQDFFNTDLLILNIPPGRRKPDVATYHPQQVKVVYEHLLEYDVPRLLFIGSTGIYGNVNQLVTEEDLPLPETESGKALLAVEQLLNSQKKIDVTILRMSGLAGGDRKAGRFLAGKKNVRNGEAPVNLVHRDDCIRVIYEIIRQQKWGELFNLCADEHPFRKDFYTSQAKKQGFEPPEFLPDTNPSYKVVSNKKVKTVLNYTFLHPDPMKF